MAFGLVIAMLIPMLSLGASAASLSESRAKDVIVFHEKNKKMKFTPNKTGYYNIFASAPRGLIGKIVDLFFVADPYFSAQDENFNPSGYLDDYFGPDIVAFEFEDEDGTQQRGYDFEFLSAYFNGYIYLTAGETYSFSFGSYSSATVAAYSVSIRFASENVSVDCSYPEKYQYSVSEGEVEFYESNPGVFLYYAIIDETQLHFRITLDDGTVVSLRNAADYEGYDPDVFLKSDFGRRASVRYDGFGHRLFYFYTVVA
ncbi:MAG: hypothetical protein IJT44_12855 [Clostridia bacterium]|nr:hypothetical protein [Clostridia bacterium]